MAFSYYVMFIHNLFIFKKKAYQLKIKYDQDKFGVVFLDALDTIKGR